MDDDQRTVWCGNLSEKVTEDILYELFLQGGPVQKVSIPKDRDGKQRNFGFVTFKHEISVPYVLELFQGTTLFDRILTIKTRNNIEPQVQLYPNNGLRLQEELQNIYQLPDSSMFANSMPLIPPMFEFFLDPHSPMLQNRLSGHLGPRPNQDDSRSQRAHPYQRERERDRDRDRERDKNDYRDRSDHRERHSSHRSHNYGRSPNHKNKRNNYRQN